MKKGQITIFIIIGLLIILSVGLVLYFTSQQTLAPVKRAVAVPQGGEDVYDYVVNCINTLGKEALITMGTQGGFVSMPPIIERNPNAHILADPLGVRKVPLWYYEGEDRVPTLGYMQKDVQTYIQDNLRSCTDFTSFTDRTIVPAAELIPIVTFTDSDVVIEVKWNIDIESPEKLVQLTEFVSVFPVRYKQLYDLATTLMTYENEYSWFENLTVDFLSMNPDIPVSGMEFSCGPKRWLITNIKQELQQSLHYLLPQIRIANTVYPEPDAPLSTYNRLKDDAKDITRDLIADKQPRYPTATPPDAYEMNRMMLDLSLRRTDLKATFVYDNYPLLINAQPNRGGVLSTSQMRGPKKYLGFFCINTWHFAYDVIYPVKMMIRDDTAFGGEGYIFQFAFPVIVEDNHASRELFGLRRFEASGSGVDVCSTVGTQRADIRVKGFVPDSPVAVELSDVNITYRCLSMECALGQTFGDGSGNIRLFTYLPEGCANPTIAAHHEGYLPNSATALEERVDITLTPLKTLNYSFQVVPYQEYVDKENPTRVISSEWLDAQSYTRLPRGMHATVLLSAHDFDLEQYKDFDPSITDDPGMNQLDFILDDADYNLDIILMKDNLPVGGYHAENITIRYDDIVNSNNVLFRIVEYRPLPKEDFQQAGMFFFLYEKGKKNDQPYTIDLEPLLSP